MGASFLQGAVRETCPAGRQSLGQEPGEEFVYRRTEPPRKLEQLLSAERVSMHVQKD